MKQNYKKLWLLPCALIPFGNLFAQQDEGDEEVFELSPFTVTGGEDIGYQATSTLAGTRIRTNLSDIGSSISIVNKEFLDDTASTNLQDVLVFTPNTEVGGIAGNFSASQGFGAGNPIPELERDNQQGGVSRIRGLAEADLTRNYFITEIPFDTYNVDRVAVQRGANSALFGLGSPGGIVNHTLIEADFLRNRGEIKFKTDEHGTERGTFRYNQVLQDDRLALLVAGLYENKQYEQEEAYAKDRRIYTSIRYKASENITLFGNIEFGDRNRSAPDFTPPNDAITPWLQTGKQTFDNAIDSAQFFRGDFREGTRGLDFFSTYPGGVGRGFVSFYQDPSNPDATFGGNVVLNSGHTPEDMASEWRMLQPRTITDIIRRTGAYPDGTPVPEGSAGFFSSGNVSLQMLDRSIFDYRKHLFSGGSSQQNAKWKAYQVGAEGTWFDGRAGAEVTLFNQDWNEDAMNALQGSFQRSIFIDPNRTLIATDDGTPTGNFIANPTFGMPVMGGLSGGNERNSEREAIRATGFLELRADDFIEESMASRILGRLRLTGVAQRRDTDSSQAFSRDKIDHSTVAGNTLIDGDIGNAPGANFFRAGMMFALPVNGSADFLGASSLGDLQGANIGAVPFGMDRNRPPRNNTYTAWDASSQSFVEFESTTHTINDNNNYPASFFSSKDKVRIDSKVLVGQQYLWDDTIVLMGTWREDKQKTASVGAPPDPDLPSVENVFDPVFLAGPQGLTTEADEQTRSWSVMIHTPDFVKQYLPAGMELSIYKSDSENFQPSGDRVNVFNEQIDPVTGSTIEEGFILSLFEGKLNIRANWYDTGVLNQSFDVGGVSASESILLNLARQLDNPDNVAQGFTAADVQAVLPPQGVIDVNGFEPDFANADATTNRKSSDNGTQDFTSEGNEIEVAYNPTPRWTMILGIARQETITSNTYPVLSQYVEDFVEPVWVNSSFAQNYVINDDGSETLADAATRAIVNPVSSAKTQDGIPQIEQREWRINFNTSYNFGRNSDLIPDFLGDLTVGGGVRWQDEVGIGFEVAQNELGDYGLDPENPFFGPSQTFIDVFARASYDLGNDRRLAIQVNIKDLFDNDDLVPIYANPDGSRLYRFLEGRLISASATYSF